MNLGLTSAVVPVTGAAGGIGLAICKCLRAAGATPLLLDVNQGALDAAAQEVFADEEDPLRYTYLLDVSDSAAVESCFARMVSDHGRLTHAVSNAGIVGTSNILEISDEEWSHVLGVNLNGMMYFCRAAARHMAPHGRGAIVNMASVAGLAGKTSRPAYTASKAAVINMTRTLAIDLGGHGIRVNAVAPGVVETAIQKTRSPEALKARAAFVPLGRLGQPDDIANVVLFLLSDKAGYVSGQTLVADGGLTAAYPG